MKHSIKEMTRKKYSAIIYGLITMCLLSACEKVIDLKLENASPMLVIEGGISDQTENQTVRISRTYDFTEPNKFNAATGATVALSSDNRVVFNYVETSPGIYRSPRLKGKSGIKYTMTVTLDGKEYTASSTMPEPVQIDSLTFKEITIFGKSKNYVAANYLDPEGVQNQYRFILKAEGKVQEDAVSEDRFNDGKNVARVIYYELNDLVKGDVINVELQCIDKEVYRYFYSLGQNSGGGGPPVAPSNPPSNFNNGALGVFNAYTTSSRTAVIK